MKINYCRYFLYGMVLTIGSGTVSCSDDPDLGGALREVQAVSSITLGTTIYNTDARNLYMLPNQEVQLTCTVLPETAENKDVAWTVQNNTEGADGNIIEAVTVTSDGLVVTKAVGTAIVRVTPAIGFGPADATPSYTINVVDHFNYIEEITVKDAEVLSTEGISESATYQLEMDALPENATFKRYKFESKNPEIATVDENGLITGVAAGTATITITADDFSTSPVSADITVKVNPVVPIEDVAFKEDAVTYLGALGYGEVYDLKQSVNLTPSNATVELLSWSSDNETVASVNANGILTVNALSGSANITASYGPMEPKTITVTIAGGRLWYSFANGNSAWSGADGASLSSDAEKTTVTLSGGNGSLSFNGNLPLSSSYPILAMKIMLPCRVSAGNNDTGTLFIDTQYGRFYQSSGNGNNVFTIVEGYESLYEEDIPTTPMILYFDLTHGFGGNSEHELHTLPSEGVDEIGNFRFRTYDFSKAPNQLGYYELYWVRSFKDEAALTKYLSETENTNNE